MPWSVYGRLRCVFFGLCCARLRLAAARRRARSFGVEDACECSFYSGVFCLARCGSPHCSFLVCVFSLPSFSLSGADIVRRRSCVRLCGCWRACACPVNALERMLAHTKDKRAFTEVRALCVRVGHAEMGCAEVERLDARQTPSSQCGFPPSSGALVEGLEGAPTCVRRFFLRCSSRESFVVQLFRLHALQHGHSATPVDDYEPPHISFTHLHCSLTLANLVPVSPALTGQHESPRRRQPEKTRRRQDAPRSPPIRSTKGLPQERPQ